MVNHTLAHRSYGSRETLCLFFQTLANLYSCHLMQLPAEPSDALSMQFEALSFLLGPVMVRNQAPMGSIYFSVCYVLQAFQLLLESAKGSKAQSHDFECLVQVLSQKLTAHSSTVVDRSQSAIAVPAWTQRFIHLSSPTNKGRETWTSKPLHVSESIPKKNVLSSVLKVAFLLANNMLVNGFYRTCGLGSWEIDSGSFGGIPGNPKPATTNLSALIFKSWTRKKTTSKLPRLHWTALLFYFFELLFYIQSEMERRFQPTP